VQEWDSLKSRMSPEARSRVEARVTETLDSMPLAEVRKAVGLTQSQLAATLEMGQGSVSKIENATDLYVSTLRRFIHALGGEMTITVSFPDGREMPIGQFAERGEAPVGTQRSA